MNQQEPETVENLTLGESSEDFFQLADLHLTDEEGPEIKGGTGPNTSGGSIRLNHNETTAEDVEAKVEAHDDLEVEEAESVKGGTGPETYGGSLRLNHNETMAVDDEVGDVAINALADLTLREEQAAQITGGPANTYRGTTTINEGVLTIR